MSASSRPSISSIPQAITYNSTFTMQATLPAKGVGNVQVVLSGPGFHTHGQAMSQRMVMMQFHSMVNSSLIAVVTPRDASVMPPGVYLVFVVEDGIPSVGSWLQLG